MDLTESDHENLKDAARAQLPDSVLAGLVRMDEGEFQIFLSENEELRRTLMQERAAGQFNIIKQIHETGTLGTNYTALRDAAELCGINLDSKKTEAKGQENWEAVAEGISDNALYLMEKIHTNHMNITEQKLIRIEQIIEEPNNAATSASE